MKFTLSWLRDHLDTTASVDEIATTLTDPALLIPMPIIPPSQRTPALR